jgi:hypothetical protein
MLDEHSRNLTVEMRDGHLQAANASVQAGSFAENNQEVRVDAGASGDLIGYVPVRSFFALDMEESRTEASDRDLQKSALGIPSDVLLHLSSRLQRSPA